jgi:uracil-DNA glycosylase
MGRLARGVRARSDVTPLETLRRKAAACTACPLYRHATQTVFGEGAAHASIVLVGEQPGHEEDLAGRPFVGPAGRLLDHALAEAGLERRRLYVTNAVKHFKWSKDRSGGKRRIHERPSQSEVEACRPWLEQELWLIRPEVVVCLGVTAAQSVLRRRITIGASRGRPLISPEGFRTLVTVHPSAILRIPDPTDREAEQDRFVDDLRRAARLAHVRAREEETTG